MASRSRRVDCSMAPRGLWLVKIPRYLSEMWDANSGNEVGRLVVDQQSGTPNLTLFSHPGLARNALANNANNPEKLNLNHLQQAPEEHSFIFNNGPGHVMVAAVEDKTDLREDSAIRSGKLTIQGRIVKRADCRPSGDKYMRMKIEQIQKNQMPKKFIQQLDRAAVKFKPISAHAEDLARKKLKKEGNKLVRADEDVVRTALFQAFERHQYYRLHDLQQLTQQPAGYLKEILQEIATYNSAPPHKSMWELKPEYRNYSIKQ